MLEFVKLQVMLELVGFGDHPNQLHQTGTNDAPDSHPSRTISFRIRFDQRARLYLNGSH